MSMLYIISIITPIFLLISTGFAAVRLQILSKADTRALGLFVINFALPFLLFKALSQRSFAEIWNPVYLVAYALGSLAVMLLGIGITRFGRGRSLSASALYGMGMSFSNTSFIGYPVALQLIGPPAAIALALCMIVENVLLIPLTLALAESDQGSGEKLHVVLFRSLTRLFRSPLILAIIAGFAAAILRLELPAPVARAVDMLAMASSPVALFVIGGSLVGLQVTSMIGDVVQIMLGKLVLHPLAVLAALMLLPPIDPALQLALLTMASVPMLSIYTILGQRFGHEEVCAAALLVTTAVSFVTLSLILWLAGASLMTAAPGR